MSERSGYDAAVELATKIIVSENPTALIVQAFHDRAWRPLRHPTWADFCSVELQELQKRLADDVDERNTLVRSLRSSGLTHDVIAAVVGTSRHVVRVALDGDPESVQQQQPQRQVVVSAPRHDVVISIELFREKLQPTDFLLWASLESLRNVKGKIIASHAEIAERSGLSKSRVCEHLPVLEARGLLEVVHRFSPNGVCLASEYRLCRSKTPGGGGR